MDKYFEEVKKQLLELGIEAKLITPQTKISQLYLDSLDLMQLIIENEQKFNILIPEERLKKVKFVSDIVNLLKEYSNKSEKSN